VARAPGGVRPGPGVLTSAIGKLQKRIKVDHALALGIPCSQLRPIDHLPNAGCPVLLIAGTEDRHTTSNETAQMFSVAREPKELWLVDGAAHEDLHLAAPDEYKSRVLGFLNQHLSVQVDSAR